MLIYRLTDALLKSHIEYAIVGGYALALHGAVRGTVDIDLVISLKKTEFIAFESMMRALGFEPRLPVSASQLFDFRKEYILKKNLIVWSFFNPRSPIEVVDVLITENLTKLKTVQVKAGKRELTVVSIADLIRLKAKSGRPQDLVDIQALKALQRDKI